MLVNAVYLYDDKITLIFNSGDHAVTLDAALLEKIEQQADSVPVEDRFVYEQLASTKGVLHEPFYFVGGFAVTIWFK